MNAPSSFPASPGRRGFLFQTGSAAALAALGVRWSASAAPRAAEAFPMCGLEKHFFERYSTEETAVTFAEIGIDIELTVRPDGHIRPERAADELPLMAAALARRQRRILIVASSFVRPDEPHVEATLRAAKSLGIGLYRHRGFRYRAGKPLREQIADFRSMAREFAAMNRAIGVQALYQNHAGADFAGAAIWDLDLILDDIPPEHFGVALDVRHLLVEQGRAWPTAIELIAPRVGALFVKSFRWERDRPVETPLRDGIVTPEMLGRVVGERAALPVCLHVEHPELAPVPFAERAGIVDTFRDDARVLREWLRLV